jgi:hypothetical protein
MEQNLTGRWTRVSLLENPQLVSCRELAPTRPFGDWERAPPLVLDPPTPYMLKSA